MIKNAQKQDAKICIKLLNLAMEDIAYKLSGYDDPARSDEPALHCPKSLVIRSDV